jgi:DNA-directed RNA polymerase specialized sigma24 family protein
VGVAYCELVRRLTEFFRRRGEPAPAEAADETVDRIAARLTVGEKIDHLERYTMGVARLVSLERYRRRNREHEAVVRFQEEHEATEAPDEAEFELQSHCLSRLPEHERSLLLAYYEECAGYTRFQRRRELASRLGVSISQLRLRIHRLCRKLDMIWSAETSRG